MDSTTLMRILQHYRNNYFYYGVFPIDKLPAIEQYPSCLIVNNQTSEEKGEHWIAIYFSKARHCEFFDSFGNSPSYYGLSSYLKKYSKRVKYNKGAIQSNVSPYCGLYSVFFLIFKLQGRSMKYYLEQFKKNPLRNDLMFARWIEEYF